MKSMFGSYFLSFYYKNTKNTENTKDKEQKQFLKNIKILLFIFSKKLLIAILKTSK